MALNNLRKSQAPAIISILLTLVLGLIVLTPTDAGAYDDKLPLMNIRIQVEGDPDTPTDYHAGQKTASSETFDDFLAVARALIQYWVILI